MSDTSPNVITYGDHTIDIAALPEASVMSLIRKGLTHFLGNEQASKVTEYKKANPGVDDAALAAYKAEKVKEAVENLLAGKVGMSAPRPRGTALETIMREIAEKEVRAVLKAAGKTFPTGDKTLDFGNGVQLTRADLIARRLGHAEHGPRIRTAAEKEMAARERLANKELANSGGDLAALGL